jgi:hypothetical protein
VHAVNRVGVLMDKQYLVLLLGHETDPIAAAEIAAKA